MSSRQQIHEIYDRRTGEEWLHLRTERKGLGVVVTVQNVTTKQIVTREGGSAKFALLDALIACGCPRNVATEAARLSPAW